MHENCPVFVIYADALVRSLHAAPNVVRRSPRSFNHVVDDQLSSFAAIVCAGTLYQGPSLRVTRQQRGCNLSPAVATIDTRGGSEDERGVKRR
jgi:hypothetical protein